MVRIYRFSCIVALGIVMLMWPGTAEAVGPSKGISISPLRQEVKVEAGKSKSIYVTVGNLSDQPMMVSMSSGQFSAADYSYDLKLQASQLNWIKPREPQKRIEPGRSEKIWYEIVAPEKATPGGYYFTLSASATIEGAGLRQTVQAISLLYVTVEGELVRTSVLQDASIPFLVSGTEIPYKFDVKDTGNVHFSAYFYGQLESLFGKQAEVGTSHILLPGVARTITGSIPSPLLPGIYRVEYGYRVDFASIVIAKTAYIIYIPPWSIVVLILALFTARWIWRKKWRSTEKTQPTA